MGFTFENELKVNYNLLFIVRSILGNNLRNILCILKNTTCPKCPINRTCFYARFFESLNYKEGLYTNSEKVTHPFNLEIENINNNIGKKTNNIVVAITLYGSFIKEFFYVYLSLKRASHIGVFKNKNKFTIDYVQQDGVFLKFENENLILNNTVREYVLEPNIRNKQANTEKYKILIFNFLTPLRIKYKGNYTKKISSDILFYNIIKKILLISFYYGELKINTNLEEEINGIMQLISSNIVQIDSLLFWNDLSYVSRRQKTKIKLGGVQGGVKYKIKINLLLEKILEFLDISNIGKNTTFGLGRIYHES